MNVAVLVGRLTADPDLRSTAKGTPVAAFTVAVDRPYTANGQKQTDFINCAAWRGTAEFVSKYFTKGQLIGVEGSIQVRTYDDKDGKRRYATEVVAANVRFVGSKAESGGARGTQAQQAQTGAYPTGSEDFSIIEDDGDLPF